jgi:hypothetical protein
MPVQWQAFLTFSEYGNKGFKTWKLLFEAKPIYSKYVFATPLIKADKLVLHFSLSLCF